MNIPANRDGISAAQFVDAYQALAFANCYGCIVDTTLDVSWSLHGITAEAAVATCQADLLGYIADWPTLHELPTFYIWVLEQGATYGLHSHIVLHLPAHLEAPFRGYVVDTLTRIVRMPLLETEHSTTCKLQVRGGETTFAQWQLLSLYVEGRRPPNRCHWRHMH